MALVGTLAAAGQTITGPSLTLPNISLDSALAPLSLPDQSFALSPAPISQQRWAYLIYANGSQVGMVVVSPRVGSGWDARLLANADDIRLPLAEYWRSQNISELAQKQLEAAHTLVLRFNSSRKDEQTCKRLFGAQSHACDSMDSCKLACFSSTEFCLPLAQANGLAFVAQIWEYRNLTRALDEAVAGQEVPYAYAHDTLTPASVSDYRRALQPILAARDAASAHPFLGSYSYCKPPAYDNASLTQAQADLDRANEILLLSSARIEPAQALANATAARMRAHEGWMQKQGLLADVGRGAGGAGSSVWNALVGEWSNLAPMLPPVEIGLGIVLSLVVAVGLFNIRKKRMDAPSQKNDEKKE